DIKLLQKRLLKGDPNALQKFEGQYYRDIKVKPVGDGKVKISSSRILETQYGMKKEKSPDYIIDANDIVRVEDIYNVFKYHGDKKYAVSHFSDNDEEQGQTEDKSRKVRVQAHNGQTGRMTLEAYEKAIKNGKKYKIID